MSLKGRLKKLERDLCPPGTCPACGMDEKPDYVNVVIYNCPTPGCPCRPSEDCYDPAVFCPQMYPLDPCCIRCRQHRGLHTLQCRFGYEDRQEQKWSGLQPGMGKR